MKLAYQISQRDVRVEKNITSYHGDYETCFKRVRECGYDGVEIMVANPDKVDTTTICALSQKYELEIPMICTGEIGGAGFTFSSLDDDMRLEALRRAKGCVDIAAALGGHINIGRIRGSIDIFSAERSRERAVTALIELTKYATEKSVRVALEPINSIVTNFINTTYEGLALVREIGLPMFEIMLDLQHMYLEDADIVESIIAARDVVKYIHVMGSNRLIPGTGNSLLDIKRTIRTLHDIGYNGYLTVEIFQRPNQEVALQKSYEYLEPLVREYR